MPLLNVAVLPAPDRVVVRLLGEADLSSAGQLTDSLAQAGRSATSTVVIDVAAVRFWDLSGLYALIEFTADLATEGRSCRIVGAPAATRRLIALAFLGEGLHLDGPMAALPSPRSEVPGHGIPARTTPDGDLALMGGGTSTSRRSWHRRG